MIMLRFLPPVLLAMLAGSVHAQVYKCVGPDGVVEYSNAPGNARQGRNCQIMQLSPVTSVPAPSAPAAPSSRAAAQPSPPNFPKVDSTTQKRRDTERISILEEELRKEEAHLATLRKEYNNGEPERLGNERNYQKYLDRVQGLKDQIARSEANLIIIQRELQAAGKAN